MTNQNSKTERGKFCILQCNFDIYILIFELFDGVMLWVFRKSGCEGYVAAVLCES